MLLGVTRRLLAEFGTRCAPPIASRSSALERKLRATVGSRHAAAKLAQGNDLELEDGLAYARWGRVPGAGESPPELSAREREVAELVAQGLTSRQIAQRLHVSVRTVDSHVEHAFKKLGLNSRTQLALWFTEKKAAGNRGAYIAAHGAQPRSASDQSSRPQNGPCSPTDRK
jgi:non-specific serine/threonine protein kinase